RHFRLPRNGKMVEVPTVYITAAVILLLFAGVLLRRKGRTRVDKCVIWVFAGYALHYPRVLPRWTAGHPIRCRGRCSAGWGQVPLLKTPVHLWLFRRWSAFLIASQCAFALALSV